MPITSRVSRLYTGKIKLAEPFGYGRNGEALTSADHVYSLALIHLEGGVLGDIFHGGCVFYYFVYVCTKLFYELLIVM